MGEGTMFNGEEEKDEKNILKTIYQGVEGFISKLTGNKINSIDECESELDLANKHIQHLRSEVEDKKEIIRLLKRTGTR